jgi:hypothetical protein
MLPLIWLYAYLAVSIPALLIVYAFRRWHNLKTLLNRPTATLELIPPALSHKSSLATERLFTVLHGLGVDCFSFEVVSSRSGGIRYLLQVAETEVDVFEQQLVAYLPDIQFRVVSDYTDFRLDQRQSIRLVEFKQLRHFAYPLAAHQDLAKHDPIAYLTGAMTGLETNELVAFQLVLSATHPPEVSSIRRALLHGQKPELSPNIWAVLLGLEVKLLLAAVWLARECMAALYGPQQSSAQTSNNPPRPVPVSTTLLASIENKLAQPLFRVNIRTLVIVENKQRGRSVLQAIKAALGNFTVPGYQQLASWRLSLGFIGQQYQLFMFRRRWLALFATNSCVLSASEVSALYHFPYGKTSRTENLVQSYAKTLPVPLSVKRHADASDFDLVLGQNQHHGNTTAIGLTAAERERHVYIIGGTGNGKTTLLQYGIVQDIRSGKGLAIIDPHGDLATTILKYIPEQRMNDVIYFNPSDFDYPIGLNLLEVPAGLSGSELLHEQDMVTESVISILRKTFSEDDSGGHRIEYVLRNAIHTAMTVPDATLFTVLTLLTDTKYRNKVVKQLDDQLLKSFWTDEMGRAGAMQQVKMSNGVTTKIGRFQASVSAQRVLGQARSTIDFEDIINSGKILICNYSVRPCWLNCRWWLGGGRRYYRLNAGRFICLSMNSRTLQRCHSCRYYPKPGSINYS